MKLSKKLDLSKIKKVTFSDKQFISESQVKTQIVLHHSAGWDNARGMFAGWAKDSQRVATCVGIEDQGTIYQGFWSGYWAYHIYLMSRYNNLPSNMVGYKNKSHAKTLEMQSIGVEICNWGSLTMSKDGSFKSWAGVTVDESKVIEYESAFKGFNFYEKYTEKEIESIYQLCSYWGNKYGIPLKYSDDIWDVNLDAISGQPGIYTHVSYRTDKSDCHPQPNLIEALKAL